MTTAPRPTAETAVLAPDAPLPPLDGFRISLPAGVQPFKLELALHHRHRRLSRRGGACLHARLFHLERPRRGDRRHPSVRAVRHQPLLSPASHPPRPEMSQMARARHGRHRDVLPAGNPGALGRHSPPPPSIRRRTAGPAHARWQASSGAISAGSWSISRNSRGSESTNAMPRTFCATGSTSRSNAINWLIWINLLQMPLFFGAGFAVAWLFGRNAGRGGADGPEHSDVRRIRTHGRWSGTSPGRSIR